MRLKRIGTAHSHLNVNPLIERVRLRLRLSHSLRLGGIKEFKRGILSDCSVYQTTSYYSFEFLP